MSSFFRVESHRFPVDLDLRRFLAVINDSLRIFTPMFP
jgi:hypothetical protein